MPTETSEDTEITLGTGKMLALFFALVALCAVFFAVGFSLGKASVLKPVAEVLSLPQTSSANSRPSAVKTPDSAASETATLKPITEKPPDVGSAGSTTPDPGASATSPDAKTSSADPAGAPVLNGYYVQVAAVSKQEDADALVDALKKKQYPAFAANTNPDKLFHVQVGPYGEIKDAEAMRAKLVSDGYNPILKK